MAETYSAGIVTAYGAAVRGGYTGTYEDWCRDMAQLGDNVQQVAEDREFVEETAQTFTAETVPGAVQTVQQAGAAQVAIVQQAGETASQQVTETGTQQVGRVQIAGAEQIEAAQEQAQAAAESAEAAAGSATGAAGSANDAGNSASAAAQSASAAADSETAAKDSETAAKDSETAAAGSASAAADSATAAAQSAEAAARSEAEAKRVEESIPADYTELSARVDAIEEAEGLHRYGVSGVGQSAAALTRIWDSVGMTAQVGTDGDNSNVVNNFDDVTPFNRRKCVGNWTLSNGKPVFHVQAYYGEDDYTEDGTKGDYVAVECPRAYYYFKDGVLGVSAHQWQGWRPFDIFCRDHDPEDTLPYAYLPAYALALKNGKAVSLPGYDNVQGSYKDIMDACRTYDGDGVQAKAHAQPMAVNFYEWALFTVEFATQNCQSIMQGCAGLRHNADDRATLRADGKWLLNNYFASRVVGEYVSIQPTTVDINAAAYYASHRITAITRCDAEGNASASGAYQLVETEDLGLNREYTVGESYRFAARPWRTGACNGVSTPSGSPVSNSNSYYPMKYRWRENVYSNQYKTVADLFNKRVGTGDDDWILEWYYLLDPSSYTPSTQSKPDATDLATSAFVLLDVETAHANYVDGYIKSKKYSEEFPDVWIPYETTGGSASTYFCDYVYLVNSTVVRACRFGGSWYNGTLAGFSYLDGSIAPSAAIANYGGNLFFPQ